MIFFIIAGPGSASQTLKNRLIKTKFFFNKKNHLDLKSGKGLGHFNIKLSKFKLISLKILNLLNFNLLFYQHLYPSKENLNKLENIFGIENIIFIFVTRNIFSTAKHLKKLFLLKKKLPLDGKRKIHYSKQIKHIIKFYCAWSKYFEKYPKKLNLITFNQITKDQKKTNKIFSDLLKKKITLSENIVSNKYQEINITLSEKETKEIKKEIKKYNKINFFKINVL